MEFSIEAIILTTRCNRFLFAIVSLQSKKKYAKKYTKKYAKKYLVLTVYIIIIVHYNELRVCMTSVKFNK